MPPKAAQTTSSVPAGKTAGSSSEVHAIQSLVNSYDTNTPSRLKLIDAFLVFIMLSGAIQFAYCVLVTDYPFNAFLAGYVDQCPLKSVRRVDVSATCRFSSTVGQFVLTASLRSQVNPQNREQFKSVSPERCVSSCCCIEFILMPRCANSAFADFALGSIVLHFFTYNFLG